MSNKTDEVTMIADIIRGISPKSLGVTSVHADKHGVVITEEFRGYPPGAKKCGQPHLVDTQQPDQLLRDGATPV